MGLDQASNLASLFLFIAPFAFTFAPNVMALQVDLQTSGLSATLSRRECSSVCESDYCSVPPLLRYGKYCGLGYSGCPGEGPCDGLDACCQTHDNCVQAKNDYLSQECNQEFLDCISEFRASGRPSFEGNKCDVQEVIDVIYVVIEAALLAGRALHKP
ncbi:phospholipase A2-alpha isoform X2 [Amborella trichopoda]|uniref:phospholipase A2-alpha isoform X2 n=1 Tax=Amborella trichopoda TaxID=13333 RepID=UPI0005D42052|nr:phospholipase A2-alpha isoform X2 [Amborella trichopoda]|eukprot:XP_011621207.1 phospholipase A2-alpha isoform X2 [Amborella trichopoda]